MVKFQIKEFNFTPKKNPWVVWTAQQGNPCAEIPLGITQGGITMTYNSDIVLSITRSGQENLRNVITLDHISKFR